MPVSDRRYEEWPTANLNRDVEFLPQTPTEMAKMDVLRRAMASTPPVTPMGQQLGLDEIMRMQEFAKLIQPDLYGSYSSGNTGVRGAQIPADSPPPPPANIQAPEPQGGYGGPLPDISTTQFGTSKPNYNMGITLPASIGDIRASGTYTTPEQWRAMIGLRKEF